jgi:hypothetical protein
MNIRHLWKPFLPIPLGIQKEAKETYHEKTIDTTTDDQATTEENTSEVYGSDPENHTRPQHTCRQPGRLGKGLQSFTDVTEATQMEPKRRNKSYSNKILLSSVFKFHDASRS